MAGREIFQQIRDALIFPQQAEARRVLTAFKNPNGGDISRAGYGLFKVHNDRNSEVRVLDLPSRTVLLVYENTGRPPLRDVLLLAIYVSEEVIGNSLIETCLFSMPYRDGVALTVKVQPEYNLRCFCVGDNMWTDDRGVFDLVYISKLNIYRPIDPYQGGQNLRLYPALVTAQNKNRP